VARLAEKLGISRIIVPPNAGVGSAVGFAAAPSPSSGAQPIHAARQPRPRCRNHLLREMRRKRRTSSPGAGGAALAERRFAFMPLCRQGHEIVVKLPDRDLVGDDPAGLRADFEREYTALFSRTIPNAEIEILTGR